MNRFAVNLTEHPDAAAPLAVLYGATEGGKTPIAGGKTCKGDREKLAALVGGKLAEVLRDGSPIRVRPRNSENWLILVDVEKSVARADLLLPQVIRAEMRKQGLTQMKLGERAGLAQSAIQNLLSTNHSPSWWLIKATLAGLGKDLHWLADELAKA